MYPSVEEDAFRIVFKTGTAVQINVSDFSNIH